MKENSLKAALKRRGLLEKICLTPANPRKYTREQMKQDYYKRRTALCAKEKQACGKSRPNT